MATLAKQLADDRTSLLTGAGKSLLEGIQNEQDAERSRSKLRRIAPCKGFNMADARIPLSELIAELRRELAAAQSQEKGLAPRFKVEETEIELQVVITREGEVGGGVKFWVYNVEAKGKLADAITQKIRLKLKPIDAGGDDLVIRATE